MESPVLAEKVFNPFNFPTPAPKIEPAQEAEEIKAVGPESVDSTESSTKDDSVLSEIEPPKKFHATVGPSLAKLDPAVARASQNLQVIYSICLFIWDLITSTYFSAASGAR